MREKLIDWLESNIKPCFYKENLGFECPGCGLQRSLIQLLNGNIIESLKLYPALIPIIIMFIFLIVHLIMKFKNGAEILKYMFIFNITIVIINYIFKLIN
jgi:hypothetical protein